jgi:hypothetical protein
MSFGDGWGFGADEKESHRFLAFYVEAGSNFVKTGDPIRRESKNDTHTKQVRG